MSLYSYQVFEMVVEQGSFVKAANELNLSPSAVSHTIAKLETEFGFSLFLRDRSGVMLTQNGKQLLPYIRAFRICRENIDQEVARINNNEKGLVVVASFESAATHWIVPVIARFRESYPGIEVQVLQGDYQDVLGWIRDRKADLAMTADAMLEKGMTFEPLVEDPLYYVTPPDFVPENGKWVTAEEIKAHPLIMHRECDDYDSLAFLRANGISTVKGLSVNDEQTLFAMVEAGLGMSIMPALVTRRRAWKVNYFPIEGNAGRKVGITEANPEFRSPAAQLLKKEIIAYINAEKR